MSGKSPNMRLNNTDFKELLFYGVRPRCNFYKTNELLSKEIILISSILGETGIRSSADIDEHNNLNKVEMTPLWRLFDRS